MGHEGTLPRIKVERTGKKPSLKNDRKLGGWKEESHADDIVTVLLSLHHLDRGDHALLAGRKETTTDYSQKLRKKVLLQSNRNRAG